MIPYGRQSVSEDDINAVVQVLRSDFLTQGPVVGRFEAALKNYTGAAFSICMNSATSALHAACFALDVDNQSRVWTTANTFVASANCARLLGASVDFIDIDPTTGNLSSDALLYKLENTHQSLHPDVLVVVHFAGQPCPMRELAELAERFHFRIIEDASHALGASYLGEKVGSGRYSDITVFSFHPVKMITSGEGGAALTNDPQLAERLRLFSSHGVVRMPDHSDEEGGWYYESVLAAPNYRMSDIHAALGLSQLKMLDEWVARRRALVEQYQQRLAGYPLSFLAESADVIGSYHILVVRLNDGISRKVIYDFLRENDIGVQVHYVPMYRHQQFRSEPLPGMEHYYKSCLTIPLYPALEDTELSRVCELIVKALQAAGQES